jgi:hypothetical protein
MFSKSTLDTLTGISPLVSLLAVVVAMIAIYCTNKNSKRQILVVKLKELFETIQMLASYYEVFKLLYSSVMALRDINNTEIVTRAQYFSKRDEFLSMEERDQIIKYLSRLDVLTDCYTKKTLHKKCLAYKNLMFTFYDFVFNAGSLQQAISYPEGFFNYNEFHEIVADLKKDLRPQIKVS